MNNTFSIKISWVLIVSTLLFGSCTLSSNQLSSPNSELTVQFFVHSGSPAYTVSRNNEIVLENSALGVEFDGLDLAKNMTLTHSSGISKVNDSYTMLHGKQSNISYSANAKSYTLTHTSGQELLIHFQVSDDGVAFRYHIPGADQNLHHINKEHTSFNFPEETQAWLEPLANVKTGFAGTNPSYEEHYFIDVEVSTPAPDSAGWAYPALFKTGQNWVLISETGMDGTYPGTRLHQQSPAANYRVRFPQVGENYPGKALNPESQLPWVTPWRIMAIGDLATVVESTLGTDLAAPAIFEDTEWVIPGRAAWSWAKLKDESVNYETQKQFIDYAADMAWEYVLVDVNWDETIGYQRMKQLVDYAAAKNVALILWYNSSGSWNTTIYSPKSKLLTHEDRVAEFSRISEMGIKGIKVDFFGGDGQSMMAYYLNIFKDAADYQLLVNTHGATLPRGWHRTWPNLVTMESVKGFEFITFEQGNANHEAQHSALLPFTRNVFDPMDFTPMSPTEIPNIDRITTPVFEIALPVLFTSGVQHYAETPEGMAQLPGFVKAFIKEIPVRWDETKFVAGYPGKEVVLARRAGTRWFVAGINGENLPKEIEIDLSFLPIGLTGTMIFDGTSEQLFERKTITENFEKIPISMKENGGFVLLFE